MKINLNTYELPV